MALNTISHTLTPKIPFKPMASPDINQQQQTWLPYETAKDCSQGFCSIYCPQWCYIIFPPPPPLSFTDDDDSGPATFSPLVISIIGILASAFLLISYYTIISKYCGGFRRCGRRDANVAPDDPVVEEALHETWHVSPSSNGLDEVLISKISVYKYRRGEGLVDGTDCAVCLGEFREEESLRLLPKCSHAFHAQCIDTWLRSHSNCPLCRAKIVSVPSETNSLEAEGEQRHNETVVVIGHVEEEASSESEGEAQGENQDVPEILDDKSAHQFRRSFSMDSSRVSIADILQESVEDEFMAGGGSSSRGRGENSKGSDRRSRSLNCVMSPVAMKRSVSSGRFSFARQGKGRSSVLPL